MDTMSSDMGNKNSDPLHVSSHIDDSEIKERSFKTQKIKALLVFIEKHSVESVVDAVSHTPKASGDNFKKKFYDELEGIMSFAEIKGYIEKADDREKGLVHYLSEVARGEDGGRPTRHNEDIADEICLRLSKGESLKQMCNDDHLPHTSTIYRWVYKDIAGFRDKYEAAREIQSEHLFEDILEIADETGNDWVYSEKMDRDMVNKEAVIRSRLRVDSRKWYLSKVKPKKYGNKLDITSDGRRIDHIIVKFEDYSKPKEEPQDDDESIKDNDNIGAGGE